MAGGVKGFLLTWLTPSYTGRRLLGLTATPTRTPSSGANASQMIGDALDVMMNRVETYHLDLQTGSDLTNADGPPPVLQRNVDAGRIGFKTKRGFFEWDDQSIAKERARYENALRKCLEIFKEEGIL